jgi:putative membrane protein
MYMTMAAAGDQFEIQSSQIALTKATSFDVRQLAQKLIDDHTMMSSKLTATAAAAGLASPLPTLTLDQQQMINELQAASAFDFEQMFLKKQIVAHEIALALHSNYAVAGDTLSLRTVASSAVPIIQTHLSDAKQLLMSKGGMISGACPATHWCHSDIDALGASFSVCCPTDMPLLPPVSFAASLSLPAAPLYSQPLAPLYSNPWSIAPLYANPLPVPPLYPSTFYATATVPAGNSLTSGWARAFGTVVPLTRLPDAFTGYGNVPVGTPFA